MSGNGWFRKIIYSTLAIIFSVVMYRNLQKWSQGQTYIAYSPSSGSTLPYPSVTVCPHSYNGFEIDNKQEENRLLAVHHVVDNKLDSYEVAKYMYKTTGWARKN